MLTEDKYFLGKFAYLELVSENCPVPVLMKDFIIQNDDKNTNMHSFSMTIKIILVDRNPAATKK